MILSVSRRTDIPQYYSDWFFNRMKEGFLYVKNPMNSHQVSKIILSPDLVDLVVFWTKNPAPMMRRIGELGEIPYYIQFTLTGYGRDIEPGLPDKHELIRIFRDGTTWCGGTIRCFLMKDTRRSTISVRLKRLQKESAAVRIRWSSASWTAMGRRNAT